MMKRRITIALLALSMVALTACGKKEVTGSNISKEAEKSDAGKLLQAAVAKMEKEKVKSIKMTDALHYEDGTVQEESYELIYDTEQKIIERLGGDEEGIEAYFDSFVVYGDKEDTVYVSDETTGYDWISYQSQKESEEDSEYALTAAEFDVIFSEENGYENIVFKDEGEEEYAGVKAKKISVTADAIFDSGFEAEKTTRKAVLEENEWTEEQVALVDGFSEILDAYVAASGDTSEDIMEQKVTLMAWVDPDTETLLKTEMTNEIAEEDEENPATKAEDDYNNNYWKVELIKDYMESGMSGEEAKKQLQNAADESGEYVADDGEVMEEAGDESDEEFEGSDEYIALKSETLTKVYRFGEDCPNLGALPENCTEVSEDEYFEMEVDEEAFADMEDWEDAEEIEGLENIDGIVDGEDLGLLEETEE